MIQGLFCHNDYGVRVNEMKRILYEMRQDAQQHVEILAEILKVDVTIIDSAQYRVAGSGRMKERIGDMSSYGRVVRHAIEQDELTIMDNPDVCAICRDCDKLSQCDNVCEAWLPLHVDGTVIGVLGFICFDEEQRKRFHENRDLFLGFLKQFGQLLEARARDAIQGEKNQNVTYLLENILNRVDCGVLVLDSEYRISRINQAGKKMLFVPDHAEGDKLISLCSTGVWNQDMQEYRLEMDGITYQLAGRIYDLEMEVFKKLFVFQSVQMSAKEEHIPIRAVSNELNRIQGKSASIREVKEKIQMVGPSMSSVLIRGESGTGKELVAVAIHGESDRSNYPFIPINCGSIPENLLESELFGYVKGAFTGADPHGKMGLFEAANKGTVFLDEIGDMPLHLQVKLLRVLENREIIRVGSTKPVKIDVRIVSATNKNLEEMVERGEFREDLYYRLNVIPIGLSPLRERREDIRILAGSFLDRYSLLMNKVVRGIDEHFWSRMEQYDWPGNIRELQNTVEYVMNMLPYSGILTESLLPRKFFTDAKKMQEHDGVEPSKAEEDLNLEHMESKLIKRALVIYGASPEAKKVIADELGIGIATLYRKIKKYQL